VTCALHRAASWSTNGSANFFIALVDVFRSTDTVLTELRRSPMIDILRRIRLMVDRRGPYKLSGERKTYDRACHNLWMAGALAKLAGPSKLYE
jgi:hypothetical protein